MRVGDEKLIVISVTVRGINVRIRFYSQTLCTAAINTDQDQSGTLALAMQHTSRILLSVAKRCCVVEVGLLR